MSTPQNDKPARTPQQIEADLAATRARLSHEAKIVVDTVHPNRIKQRQVEKVKDFVDNEVDAAKALVTDVKGKVSRQRLLAIGGAVLGGLVFVLTVGKLVRRGRSR